MIKMLLTLLALFLSPPRTPQNCHSAGGKVLPILYLLVSVSTKDVVFLVIRYSGWYSRVH